MAVELVCALGEENGFLRFTPATDVYSFGSTMLEILSGKVPYHTKRLDAQVIMDIYKGVRHPREETDISLMHWQLMERCWADIPGERPNCTTIVNELEACYWHQQCVDIELKMKNTAQHPGVGIRPPRIGIAF
jgi:serine/threonine protein kinase